MLTFDQEKHLYYWKEKYVPNVTRLLSEYGLINFEGVPKERLDYKSALGTAVHRAIHLYNEDNLDEESIHPEILQYFNAYKKFTEVYKFEPRYTELRMFSKKYMFAGTLDAQGLFFCGGKEIESIIDWKCTFSLYPSASIQTAAYQLLFNENYPENKVKKRFNLILKNTGNYDIIERSIL